MRASALCRSASTTSSRGASGMTPSLLSACSNPVLVGIPDFTHSIVGSRLGLSGTSRKTLNRRASVISAPMLPLQGP
ncbi:hypothetical protein N657DRAFT_640642 [Parathielavia appendiculata]|uniref:Uncharacterized protein n=1 Tax=Parathielavia appendiculata TaxID=2587402 RepID=A0AAN6U5E0_9PEZI|nr:hypothetical protein N657DRAFT_640642 [Parathielavia appendiculata]